MPVGLLWSVLTLQQEKLQLNRGPGTFGLHLSLKWQLGWLAESQVIVLVQVLLYQNCFQVKGEGNDNFSGFPSTLRSQQGLFYWCSLV